MKSGARDKRTKEEKIGSISRRDNPPSLPLSPEDKPSSQAVTINRKRRDSARNLALDYAESLILNLYAIAMDTKVPVTSRIEASKQVLYMGVGRPANISLDGGVGATAIPNFTLVFNSPVAIQQTDIQAQYSSEDDDEQED